MKIDEKKAIGLGLMSGTSLDGLDMTVIQFDFFEGKPPHRFQFLASETYDYPIEWKEKLASVENLLAAEAVCRHVLFRSLP